MGGYSQFPALSIEQPESPLKQFAQVQQIQMGQQQVEAQRIENQTKQRALNDQDALTRAMASWNGQNYTDIPALVGKVGGSGNAQLQATNTILGIREKASSIAKDDAITASNNVDTIAKQNDAYRGRVLNVMSIADPATRDAAWNQEITKEEQAGTIQPGQFSHAYPGDAAALTLANHFAMGSQIVKEQDDRQRLALDAWKPVGGQLVNAITQQTIGGLNGVKVAMLNKGLETRWQVLNPGKPVPSYFQLQPNDSPATFDQIDKILEATERAKGTVAQQQQTNAIRAQTFELARDKQDLKPVTGTNPQTGQQVIANYADAQKMGLTGMTAASDDMVNKAYAARHWLNLALRPADPNSKNPADQSIMGLIDNLDNEGKLGPLASRWNDFMAGKFGSGDPEYAALSAKMGLSTTLLQQAHVGNRGSAQLLEHFEDLANQKKMDGPTLKAGFQSEINYMKDKAADPNPPDFNSMLRSNFQKSGAGAAALPKGNGGVIDKATAMQFYAAAGNDPAKAKQLAIQNGWQVPQVQP